MTMVRQLDLVFLQGPATINEVHGVVSLDYDSLADISGVDWASTAYGWIALDKLIPTVQCRVDNAAGLVL